jgi:hypothetical protein
MYMPTNKMPMSSQTKTIYPLYKRSPKQHFNTFTTLTHTHTHTHTHTIQFIEFTYYHNRFPKQALTQKHAKYDLLINAIRNKGWKMNPLITITSGVRGAIHKQSIKKPTDLNILKTNVKKLMKYIHQNAIKYLTYLVLNKRKLDNKRTTISPP